MKQFKFVLVIFLLLCAGSILAAPVTLTFKDATTATRTLVWAENPTYPSPTPTDGSYIRWIVRVYKSTDNVINPLGSDGLPTGDDVAVTNTGGAQQLSFGPTGGWTGNTPSLICPDPIATPDPNIAYHTSGNKIYFRIFNSNSIATATKYFQATSLYTILSANATITYIPTYGWSAWITIAATTPNPAVLVLPANAATNQAYANQTLTWTAGSGAPPTGYKVYFGTDAAATNLINGTTQTATTHPTGLLLQNQTYYWKIVPYNASGDAVGCVVWSFTTRAEINPDPAINPGPANSATVQVMSFPYNQTLSWSAPVTGHAPTGYKLFWNLSSTPEDLGNVLTTSKPIPAAGPYSWQIVPYYTDPGTRTVKLGKPVATRISNPNNPRGDAVGCPTWSFTASLIVTYTVDITSTPADADIFVDGVDSGFNTPHTFTLAQGAGAIYTVQMTNYSWTPTNFVVTNIQANTAQNFVGTPSFTVDITSAPADADIFVGGVDSGFNTPHQFMMVQGSSATYTVQKAGYTWAPVNYVVTNIQANASQNFVGTIITYTVDITSNPIDSDIFVDGVDSGFTTPHQFILNYGTGATYAVQKTGYVFAPTSYTVANIQANASQAFVGSILTFTVDIISSPVDADIFVGGIDSGFNTPHQFILDYGTGATYTVQKAGYTWAPVNFVVTNIQASTSQNFTGTVLTYTVDITSTPADADIFVDGVDSGYNTPHQYILTYGSNATYTVQKNGYTWVPTNFVVTNIQANTSHNFVGTQNLFFVNITSTPSDADIFVGGVDSGFNTPHEFGLAFGANATYTVQKAGYTWAPASFIVTNIQTNTSQAFIGTLLTYTVDIYSNPTDADIFVNGVDSGFGTPHQFVLGYGSNAIYTVEETGYSYAPISFVVTGIQANTSQTFTGTLLTYTVDISSTPADADIFVDGVDSGFNTPHQFVLNYGSSANYAVAKTGYTWLPANYAVSNIQANASQNFVGTLIPFNVDITSVPSDADIYVGGIDSGFNTPHTFIMPYGSSAVYTAQQAGYSFAPLNFTVNNIQANASQNFTGTILTYTVDITSNPSNADIFIGEVDSGFNTPHPFVLNYGTSVTYTVHKAGYSWVPANLVITNIQANVTQDFVGSLLPYTVDITSVPADADIFIGGVDSGFNSPHQFIMTYGSSATYTVQKAGYTWTPVNYVVTNIQANASQNFVGALIPYNVNITSTPAGADIFVGGLDSGFNTPYQFVMNYGTSATYTVQKTGYNFTPVSFEVTNIQANTSQNFTGTLLTYTVNLTSVPTGADIYVGSIDTGFNTPYQFTLNYGTSATYSVKKAGYAWTPANFVINNITANTSQNFTGTILTYTVDISSTPTNADIFVGGVDTGFNTPHQFVLNYGSNATYTVQKAGYTWMPASFAVSNIHANTSQDFVGTIIAYNVVITSSPTNADILVGGVDTGFNTPHQFAMSYGTGATYTIQKTGYSFVPANLVVTNIQANISQNFVGTLLTYTVNITSSPVDADIYVGGVDSGYNTPHVFTLSYGANAIYTVKKTGYTWTPANYSVYDIHANASQNFTGTLLNYSVNISSIPSDADILIGGVDTGFNTPHTFMMNYGTSATYSVVKNGYIWTPSSFAVTNISANISQTFTGVPMALNVTPSNQNATYQAGTTTFTVNSNIAWTVSEDISWLSVSPNSGSNDGRMIVTYETNTSSVPRIGQITVSGSGINRIVTITQAGSAATISVTPNNQIVTSVAGTTSFAINSNTAWTVTENVSWLSVTPASGSNNGVINVTYDANSSIVPRTGRIVITGNRKSLYVTVSQAAAPVFLAVTPQNPTVSSSAGEIALNVSSNIAWTVSETVSWLSVTPMNGSNNGAAEVTYNANSSSTSREGQITFLGSGAVVVVTVSQAGASAALTVTPSIQYVSSLEGITSFTITSNTAWTISEDVAWLTVSPGNGTNNRTFVVNHQANPTNSQRTGLITITWGESNTSVSVIQFAGSAMDGAKEISVPEISVFPNPFVATTKIKVDVTGNQAKVAIYSTKGQLVRTIGAFSKGSHVVEWNGKDNLGNRCSNGFYLVRFKSNELTKTVKVLLIKN